MNRTMSTIVLAANLSVPVWPAFAADNKVPVQPTPEASASRDSEHATFILEPGATKTELLDLKGDLPTWLKLKSIEARISQSGTRTWLLPILLPVDVTLIPPTGNKSSFLSVTVCDALKQPQLHAAIRSALTLKSYPVWEQAEPIGDQVQVGLYLKGFEKHVLLGTRPMIREHGADEQVLHFPVSAEVRDTVAQEGIAQLGLAISESYLGRFHKSDFVGTLNIAAESAHEFANRITKDDSAEKKTVLVALGGGVDQRTALRKLLKSAITFEIATRRGANFRPDLTDRVIEVLLIQLTSTLQERTLDESEMVSFMLSNGYKVTGTIGEFKKVVNQVKTDRLNKTGKTDAWDNFDKSVRNSGLKIDTSFSYLNLFDATGNVDSTNLSEDERKRAGSIVRNSLERDISDVEQAVEGRLPVIALEVRQFLTTLTQSISTIEVSFGTFEHGRRTLDYRLSLQPHVRGLREAAQDAARLQAELDRLRSTVVQKELEIDRLGKLVNMGDQELLVAKSIAVRLVVEKESALSARKAAEAHARVVQADIDARKQAEHEAARREEEYRQRRYERVLNGP